MAKLWNLNVIYIYNILLGVIGHHITVAYILVSYLQDWSIDDKTRARQKYVTYFLRAQVYEIIHLK